MKPLTRREFLRLAAAGSGGLGISSLLAACGMEQELVTSTVPPTQLPTSTNTALPSSTATQDPTATPTDEPTATQTPVTLPDLVVARNDEPEELVRRALASLGGMEKFVWKGADVIVKPNIWVRTGSGRFVFSARSPIPGNLILFDMAPASP